MENLARIIEPQVLSNLANGKVLLLLGARRTGKTVLLKQVIQKIKEPTLLLNGEDMATIEWLSRRSVPNYQNLIGDKRVLIIDEAQKVPDIGQVLKLIVDEFVEVKILVTGSSAFDLSNYTGEPLTGRKKTYYLFPFSEQEFARRETPLEHRENLRSRLIYGNYPELIHIKNPGEKADYLKELVNDYLLKDILVLDNIKNSGKILDLMRLVAYQIGGELSYQELGAKLSMSKNTVERYLDLLSKVFILYKLGGFSRNLRKEITKSSKWYFYDNGIRNAIIANFNPLNFREDMGQLWQNYIISERLKFQHYQRMVVNNYFWRTYDQQEIDWVEEREGDLFGYEMKWGPNTRSKAPTSWRRAYPNAHFQIIHRENYQDWILH